MATGADEGSRSKFTASHFLARAMSAMNPGAPAVKNITNYHAYVRAVRSNEVEAVRQALESDPSYMQYEATSATGRWSILWHPVVEGDLEMMTLLLDRGADVACRGARLNGVADQYESVAFCLERGADVDVVDDRNCTPLMKAVQNNRPHVVRVLLASGCDVDREVNVYGPYSENLVTGGFQGTMTPLQFARRRPRREINSLFDTFLLARLVVAGRRSGHLAAVRRVLM